MEDILYLLLGALFPPFLFCLKIYLVVCVVGLISKNKDNKPFYYVNLKHAAIFYLVCVLVWILLVYRSVSN